MKRNQSGFTLIEIAIVLVIIGLLLGGVLKGQELINSAKVKNLATDFKNIPVFIYGYQDKFRAFPGDDKQATIHMGAACTGDCKNGNGDGVLGGSTATDKWSSTTVTDETQLFWIHTRIAGFAPGPTSGMADYRPSNASGGAIGIQSNTAAFTTIVKDSGGADRLMPGTYVICSSGIQGKFVIQLDTTMDDGETNTGAMRVTDSLGASGKSILSADILPGESYIVCMGV